MSRADPGRWSEFVEGYTAAHAAGDGLRACLDAARKTGREQRCGVTVRPVVPTHQNGSRRETPEDLGLSWPLTVEYQAVSPLLSLRIMCRRNMLSNL